MWRSRLIGILLASSAALAATPPAETRWEGVASYYDAIGYPRLSAAHRTLPFGTWVRVTDVRSGKDVLVVIADRGPFTRGRIIDLSHAAAAELGMIEAGILRVSVALASYEAEPAVRCLGRVGRMRWRSDLPGLPPGAYDFFTRKSTGWSTILMHRDPTSFTVVP